MISQENYEIGRWEGIITGIEEEIAKWQGILWRIGENNDWKN